jgi:predicted AlkP superfamily pyrophosphatase or phosphodiesterase
MKKVRRLLKERHEREGWLHRQWIEKEARKHAAHAPSAYIPLVLLPEIGVSEDNRPIYLPGAFAQQSIFDVFHEARIEYKYFMFPIVNCEDRTVLEMFLNHRDSQAKILLGQFSDTDLLIHHCGPGSSRRREIVAEMDRRLREMAVRYDEETTWVIVGDHGMTDVVEELDVPAALAGLERRLDVAMGRDYWLFLDSTMARFRSVTERGSDFLSQVKALTVLREKGRFVDEKIAFEYSIPPNDRRYGDLIWWADNGVLLFPDYFHDQNTHNKGMHGYDSNHDDMKGFLLAFGPGIPTKSVDEANLIDVCPTHCAAADVQPPRENRGVCLLD